MQDAGNRIHGTTRTPPLKRFVETEQAMLKPLPNSVPECARWVTAKLHGDCHLQVEKRRYSAPWRLVGQTLDVRIHASRMTVNAIPLMNIYRRSMLPTRCVTRSGA